MHNRVLIVLVCVLTLPFVFPAQVAVASVTPEQRMQAASAEEEMLLRGRDMLLDVERDHPGAYWLSTDLDFAVVVPREMVTDDLISKIWISWSFNEAIGMGEAATLYLPPAIAALYRWTIYTHAGSAAELKAALDNGNARRRAEILKDYERALDKARNDFFVAKDDRDQLWNDTQTGIDTSGNTLLGSGNDISDVGIISSGMAGWTVNYGKIVTRGDEVHTAPPSEGYISYYIAPSNYLGDWRRFASLTFEKRSSGGDYGNPHDYGGKGDVVLRNGSMSASFDITPEHSGKWYRFTVPFGGGWTLGGGAKTLSDVLANVTEFRIRAEYGLGDDESSLRAVKLNAVTQR